MLIDLYNGFTKDHSIKKHLLECIFDFTALTNYSYSF